MCQSGCVSPQEEEGRGWEGGCIYCVGQRGHSSPSTPNVPGGDEEDVRPSGPACGLGCDRVLASSRGHGQRAKGEVRGARRNKRFVATCVAVLESGVQSDFRAEQSLRLRCCAAQGNGAEAQGLRAEGRSPSAPPLSVHGRRRYLHACSDHRPKGGKVVSGVESTGIVHA